MSINISLSIINLFIGLVQFTAAAFAYLANRKLFSNTIIAGLLFLLGLTSIGVSFELNSLTAEQALPWVAVELFSVYAVATTTLFVAILLFIPKTNENFALRAAGVSFVFVPLFLLLLDVFNISKTLIGFPFLIDIEYFRQIYVPGYIEIDIAATGFIHTVLFWLRNITYGVLIFFPLSYVIWRDRKIKSLTKNQASAFLAATIISSLVNTVFINSLPITVPSLISNFVFTIALTYTAISNSGSGISEQRTYDFFRNLNMFNKLVVIVLGLILPSVLFIGLSVYSFLLNGLLFSNSTNLKDFAITQSQVFSNDLGDDLHQIQHTGENPEILLLLEDSNAFFRSMSSRQIAAYLTRQEETGNFLANFEPADLQRTNQPLLTLLDAEPNITGLFLVNTFGALVTTDETPETFDYSTSEWWIETTTQQIPFIGSPFWQPEEQSYVIPFGVPVFDQRGTLQGALGGSIRLDEFFSSLDYLLSSDIKYGFNIDQTTLITSENTATSNITIVRQMPETANEFTEWTILPIRSDYIMIESVPIPQPTEDSQIDLVFSAYLPLSTAFSSLYTTRYVLIFISGSILILAALASILLARTIARPLAILTEGAQEVLSGNLNVSLEISGEDELGVLGATFTQMTKQLSQLVGNLETAVETRTVDLEQRTLQMETSARVARQAAEIRDLQTLLNESVNLITEQFGYYHTGIFLLDSASKYAVLQAASSPGGQRMLARGHRLQVGKVGVVGYCAGTGLPRISQDVGADIVYYDNPDMPSTRSELALPLRVRNTVIGVLDVQSAEASAFAQEDINILQTLADQIALAIDNVRLLQSSQRALDELQRLYGQQAGQAWRQKLSGQPIAYQFTPTGIETSDPLSIPSLENKAGHKLQKEIRFRGQSIGKLNLLRDIEEGSWSEDEQALIDDILEQTALALENARLVDQIRLRSDQIQLLQEITAISTEILDEDRLIPILANKLQSSLSVEHCGMILLDGKKATLIASANTLKDQPEIGTSLEIDQDPVTQRLIRTKEVDVIVKTEDDTRWKTFNDTFGSPLTKTLIFLPIIVRDQTAGFFYLEDVKEDRQSDLEEFNLFNQISTQTSTAFENIRLFDETVNRAERERQVAEITAKIRSSNDPQEILQIAVAELKQALNTRSTRDQEEIPSSVPAPTDNGKDEL